MEKTERILHIVLASDLFFLPHAAVTILSILKHNPYRISICLLVDSSISVREKKKFLSIFSEYGNLTLSFCNAGVYFPKDLSGNRLPAMTFYRLLIPRLFTDWDRCLYLDTDLTISGDILPLYSTEMGDCLIAGVTDHYMKIQVDSGNLFSTGETAGAYFEKRHLAPESYINGGVMVFDLKQIREHGMQIFEQMLKMTNQFFEFNDQDILNIMLSGKILLLDDQWNYMNNLLPGAKRPENPVVFHHKPWVGEDIPHISNLYWDYLRETPYYFRVRSEFILHAVSVSLKKAPAQYSMMVSAFKTAYCFLLIFLRLLKKRGIRR